MVIPTLLIMMAWLIEMPLWLSIVITVTCGLKLFAELCDN